MALEHARRADVDGMLLQRGEVGVTSSIAGTMQSCLVSEGLLGGGFKYFLFSPRSLGR